MNISDTVFTVLDENHLQLQEITDVTLPNNYSETNIKNNPAKIRNGLYDELIFGEKGSEKYNKTFAYISLDCFIPKPFIYYALMSIPAFKSARSLNRYLVVTENRLVDFPDQNSVEINNETILFQDYFYNLADRNALVKFLDALKNVKAKSAKIIGNFIDRYGVDLLITNKLLVIPPGFRDYIIQDRKIIYNEISSIYAKLFFMNEQIKSNKQAYNKLLIVYDQYLEALIQKFGKKEGMLRQKLATKVVNTTTRSVIVPRNDLKENEIGIPFVSLCNMYQAEITHYLLQKKDEFYKLVEANELKKEVFELKTIQKTYSIIQMIATSVDKKLEPLKEFIRKILEEDVLPNAVVVFKRDPVIHRASWLAARPVIARQNAIELNNLYCAPLGGDYDGDSVFANINLEVFDKKTNKTHKFENISFEDLIDLEIKLEEENK